MKRKFTVMLAATSIVCAVAFGQEKTTSQIVVTNLSDQLRTRVTVDKSTGMDIRRLNLDSIHADKHKSRYTSLRDLSINTLRPRSVLMVKPLWAKDEFGKSVRVDDTYVNTYALRRLDTKNIIINSATTKSLLIQDLSPTVFYLNGTQLARVGTRQIPVTSLSVNDLNVASISAKNLAPYTISIKGLGTEVLTVFSIAIDHGMVDALKIASLDPKVVNVTSLGLDPLGIKKLQANLLSIQALSPSLINITDSSSVTSVMVIDNANWHVDTSAYDVAVTEETYAELAEMKLIYNFEQSYNESIKTEVKLNDVKKLERKQYLRWINLLAENKKCNIKLIKNTEQRKIIGEAWIQNGNYNSAVKENMLKNLKYLRSRGYDTVLVRFRCSEDIDQLKQMITDIKDDGFEVFSTFVGLDYENPSWNPFIEPETIEKYINEIAPMCTGYLLNWRSTSNHVKIIPIEYFNYLCNILRKANDQILIYGEVYYGNIDPLRMRTLIYTAPENITGVMINNMGYYGYNITYVVNNLFATSVPGYRKMDKLGQVIGVAPYYCSREATRIKDLTLKKEYDYKAKVEKAFNRTNHGTVTMLHDGVDDNQTRLIAEPGSPRWCDTTDNILYDDKIWKMAEAEEAAAATPRTAIR